MAVAQGKHLQIPQPKSLKLGDVSYVVMGLCVPIKAAVPNTNSRSIMRAKQSAHERRRQELRELAEEGVAVIRLSRWHFRIGSLHVWPAVGRWNDEKTGHSGRMYGTTIRNILWTMDAWGRRKCPASNR